MTDLPTSAVSELERVAHRFDLGLDARLRLLELVRFLSSDQHAPTTVRDPLAVVRDHIADSLEALRLDSVRESRTATDLGSGAGLPALPLAIVLPELQITAVESVARKAAFIARAAEACGVSNVAVRAARAEALGIRDAYDLVTARALAPLEVVAEYAAPLLRVGGTLVAWRGRRDADTEAAAGAAASELGMELGPVLVARPYAGVEGRHLHVLRKVEATDDRFPRRPGMARKRPLGHGSDRSRR